MNQKVTLLGAADWRLAVQMWKKGFDTLQIAKELHVSEAVVYRRLPFWRGSPHLLDNNPPQHFKRQRRGPDL